MKKLIIALLLSLGIATQVFAQPVTIDPANLPETYSQENLGWYRGFKYEGCFTKSNAEVIKKLRDYHIWTPKQAIDYWRGKGTSFDIIEEDGAVILKRAGTWDILEVFSMGPENCLETMRSYRLLY